MSLDEHVTRRFVKYMANLIHYNSINYDKKRRTTSTRFPLILDNDESNDSVLLSVYDRDSIPADLREHLTDPVLYQGYVALPEKQQRILSLCIVQGLNDKAIAKILGGSQQNISKHRLKAIEKLRNLLTEEGE